MIEDTFFTCGETPIWIPSTFDTSTLSPCVSCTVRLTAKLAGPGNVSAREDGLLLNENPTVTLTINGIQHTLVESILTFPGAHRYSGQQSPSVAEVFLYFQNTREFTQHVCLAIPLVIGQGASNAYFSTLDTGIRKDRPTVASLVPDSNYLMYKGADLRGRTGKDSKPRALCEPVKKTLTYYLALSPSSILAKDYERLMARAGTAGPPKPASEVVQSRLQRLGTLIESIRIDADKAHGATDGGITTKAMKCYKLDPKKDIVNDKVYVGTKRPGDRTLAEELEQASQGSESESEYESGTIKPGDIEQTLGIVLGVIVGVVVCAVIAYVLWKYVFTNYLAVQKLYDVPISASKLTEALPIPSLPSLCSK
jgi:Arc/MetJ family transcription regulator